MALKKSTDEENLPEVSESLSSQKAKNLFSKSVGRQAKEKKILTTFSIEPSFKRELEDTFENMGLGWAAGIRFALRQFIKNTEN
ncbi:hypothetical protein [Parasphaerochaeta coccoides]|uniref:Uncharacterized protein n=1 Tax=Parasphaerochaeta coccoides (strain ATCC BAA-1237 / DSM 17374 / SPN1) TaxID=760011 RepID=F4GLK0_PARC1|nr:hypothetical protein [Parasphaerochaeta coccoides]AEC01970.1 hypothetical protein Spico_0745 [Parasphaerochaeta coccoides DSM 17374]